jgi:hypothetical protein
LVLPVLASVPRHDIRFAPLAVVAVGAGVEAVWYVVAVLRAGRVGALVAVVDWLTELLVLVLPVLPAVAAGRPGESEYFNAVNMAAIGLGLAGWPVWAAAGTAGTIGAATILTAAVPTGSSYPVWNAVYDGLGTIGAVLVAWVIAALLRHGARLSDTQRETATLRAHELGRERERLRQGRVLRANLLTTLERLAEPGMLADATASEQVRREVEWLRGLVDGGADDESSAGEPVDLATGLAMLAAEKAALGLTVDIQFLDGPHPGAGWTRLEAVAGEAVVGAVREALTNVGKHAGVAHATVLLSAVEDALVIDVVDVGRGFDPSAVRPGLGHVGSIADRVNGIGGSIEVRSSPGTGTRVRLRVPRQAAR